MDVSKRKVSWLTRGRVWMYFFFFVWTTIALGWVQAEVEELNHGIQGKPGLERREDGNRGVVVRSVKRNSLDSVTKFYVTSSKPFPILDQGFIPITVWMTSKDHEAYKAMGLTFVLYHTWTQRSYLLGSGMSTLVSTPAFSFPISMGSLTSGEDYVVLVYAWDSILQVTVTYATQTFGIFIPNWGYPLNIAPFYPNERILVHNSTEPVSVYLLNPHLGLPAFQVKVSPTSNVVDVDALGLCSDFLPHSGTYQLLVVSKSGLGVYSAPNLLPTKHSWSLGRYPRSTGPAQLGSNNTLFIDTTLYPSTFSRAMCVSSDLGRYQLASVRGTSVKVEEENSFSGLIVLGQGPVHFVTLDNATMELNVWGPYWYGNPSFTYVPVNESTWEGDAHQTVVVGIDVQSSSGVHTLSTTSTTNTTKASLVTSSSSTTTSTKSTATPVQQMIRSRSERPYGSTPSWLWTCLMILVSMTFF